MHSGDEPSQAAQPRNGNPSADASTRWRRFVKHEWLLCTFAALALGLGVFDPRPLADYHHWLQWPALAGLTGLLVAIQGVRDSGFVQRAARSALVRMHSLRRIGLALVAAAALLSTVLTNDVSLFLIVPLTLVIGELCALPLARMVVLEALAVNAGSTLSPIGNPQNLLLWQHSGLAFPAFVLAMLPAASVMLILVFALAWCWLPRERISLALPAGGTPPLQRRLGLFALAALAGMVLMMEFDLAVPGMLLVLAGCMAMARPTLRRTDWLLLLTFAAIFVALGHVAALPWVDAMLRHLDFAQPSTVFVSGILAAQVISNVPATVLLLEHVPDSMALAVAVNVGGFGVAVGSLANIIALRLGRQPGALRLLHLASIPFLLVCAPLVYMAWRWLG